MWSLVFLVLGTYSQNCPTFSCHLGGFDLSPVCGTLSSSNNYVLQVCDNSTSATCDVTGTITNNYTCTLSPPYNSPTAYPGERCHSDSQCITNQCVNGYCQGGNAGSNCVRNADCDVGYYCSPGFYCAQQLSYGQACSHDYMCANNLACNRTLFEDGTCVYYFSIPVGGIVGMCIDMLTEGVSNLCASGTCRLFSSTDSIGNCTDVVYSPSLNYPRICSQDSDCIGIDGSGYKATGVCSCGMDMHGFAYCDAFSGDPPSQTLEYLYELHTNSTGIMQCHTQRRFDFNCISQNLGRSALYLVNQMKLLSTDTARYQGNDFCVKTIFNSQFWNQGPAAYQCKAYGCGFLKDWNNGTCITYTQGTNAFAINPCAPLSATPYCNYSVAENNPWTNVTCSPRATPVAKYPGETCYQNSDCRSGLCKNNYCAGIAVNKSCVSTQDCDVGLYCVSKNYMFSCQPLLQPFDMGCGSDFDCVPYAGCKFLTSGPPGICVPYFSLGRNNVTTCNNGISLLCSTGACTGTGGAGTCTTAPTSLTPLGTPCRVNGQCQGQNTNGEIFYGFCACGMNNQGNSYCHPFLGDAPGITYLRMMKQYYTFNGTVNKCNSARRFSSDCYNTFSLNFTQAYIGFTRYPMLIDNDDCVKAVYTNDYWKTPPPIPNPITPPYKPGDKPPVKVKKDNGLILAFGLAIVLI